MSKKLRRQLVPFILSLLIIQYITLVALFQILSVCLLFGNSHSTQNSGKAKKMYEIWSKSTIKTPEQREHILLMVTIFSLMILNK